MMHQSLEFVLLLLGLVLDFGLDHGELLGEGVALEEHFEELHEYAADLVLLGDDFGLEVAVAHEFLVEGADGGGGEVPAGDGAEVGGHALLEQFLLGLAVEEAGEQGEHLHHLAVLVVLDRELHLRVLVLREALDYLLQHARQLLDLVVQEGHLRLPRLPRPPLLPPPHVLLPHVVRVLPRTLGARVAQQRHHVLLGLDGRPLDLGLLLLRGLLVLAEDDLVVEGAEEVLGALDDLHVVLRVELPQRVLLAQGHDDQHVAHVYVAGGVLNFWRRASSFSPLPSRPVSSLYPSRNFCGAGWLSWVRKRWFWCCCSRRKAQMNLLYFWKFWLLRRKRMILSMWSLELMAEHSARISPQLFCTRLPQMMLFTRFYSLSLCIIRVYAQTQLLFQDMESQRCQVCFVLSFPPEQRRRIITCIACSATAHSYCYLPEWKPAHFTCDACHTGFKGACFICQQRGLLKRVGDRYAHPVCLLFNQSFLVRTYRDLSFVQIDALKPRGKGRCSECALPSGYVVNCGLSCSMACHAYCAFKSNERTENDSNAWRACFGLAHGASTFSDLFDSLVLKGISHNHKFLKSILPPQAKQAKKAVMTQVQLYCEQHSATLIDCRCNEIESEKERWIYCDCCCRWQHIECLENQREAEEAANDDKFYCLECKTWNRMNETNLEIPSSLPKLQIYDYVFIHHFYEINQFEANLNLEQFIFKIPIFPSKVYVERIFRRKLVDNFYNRICLDSEIKAQYSRHSNGNEAALLGRMVDVLDSCKDRLSFIWLLCEDNLFQTNLPRFNEFTALNSEDNLRIKIDLLVKFDNSFRNGTNSELSQIKSYLDGQESVPRPLAIREQRQNEGRHRNKSMKKEKPLQAFNDKLKKLVAMSKENINQRTVFDILGQIHDLVNSPTTTPFYGNLPNVPIVHASKMFKEKESAIKYVEVMTRLQYLRGEWQRLIGSNKCQDRQTFIQKRRNMLAEVQKYYDLNIVLERNDKLKEDLMREWAKNEVDMLIPSRELSLTEPSEIIASINIHNLSLKKVNEALDKYTQQFLANNDRKDNFSTIRDLIALQKFLTQFENLKFTRKSYLKIKEMQKQSFTGQYIGFVPSILNDFIRLYDATDKLLNDELISAKENACLFEKWKEGQEDASIDEESLERYLVYFKDIQGVNMNRFGNCIYNTVRLRFITLVDKIEERTLLFRNELEFKLINRWCNAFRIVPKKMGEIFKKDKDFQQAFLFLKPQFDDLQATQKLDVLVTQHLQYCKNKEIQFRVHQLQVLLTWVDLQKAVLHKVPASLLLSKQQARCFDFKVKGKPDYYVLKEIFGIMKQTKFPQCLFLERFQKIVEEGETFCQLINKVLENCSWGYELSASLDWQKKMEREEFYSIRTKVKECNYYFQAEIIELDIIKEKFEAAERQAQALKIQSQKCKRDYDQTKAKNLLISFGCFPIASKWTNFLWNLLEGPRISGLPEDLQVYVSDIEKSKRLHSWQELENLRELIHSKLSGKYQKKNYCSKLQVLIGPNRELYSKSKEYLDKCIQKSVFSEAEIEKIKAILSEYEEMQFQDEEIVMLKLKYEHYSAVKSQMKWRQTLKINDIKKLKFLEGIISTLHESFITPDIAKYQEYIGELKKVKEEQCLEQGKKGSLTNHARKGNDFSPRNSNTPRNQAEVGSRKEKGCSPSRTNSKPRNSNYSNFKY